MTDSGILRDAHYQQLEISRGIHFDSNATAVHSGHTVQSISTAAAAEAVTATTILENSNLILVTVANDANDRIYLPNISLVPIGHTITLIEVTPDPLGYELACIGDGTNVCKINGVDSTNSDGTYLKELAIPATALQVLCVKIASDQWKIISQAAASADNVSGTPDS